jgi:hypothetical protein
VVIPTEPPLEKPPVLEPTWTPTTTLTVTLTLTPGIGLPGGAAPIEPELPEDPTS